MNYTLENHSKSSRSKAHLWRALQYRALLMLKYILLARKLTCLQNLNVPMVYVRPAKQQVQLKQLVLKKAF